ncbi:MAG TPA: outer membrane lipoprotein carrier protein LolA [Novosphingobium sp.]|nr:outer membrane lipoprotein carrier protein LolA [Novosphingobium sp.]
MTIFRFFSVQGLLAMVPAALCASVPLAPAAYAQAPAPAGDLDRAVAALRGIDTLRADFTQTDADGRQVKGVLSLKRGGKIRFQYQPGYPVLIIGDGRALTVVDTEMKQVQRWPVGDSPLGALLDPRKDVARFGRVVPGYDPRLLTVEVRDRGHPEYGTLNLLFVRKAEAPGGLELAGWTTMDAQNRRTVIRLAGHHYGLALAEDLFRYTDLRARPHH